ncbi:MAG: copper-binding protein [Pseudomonadota bacterium]|nr:copper-binding protein [Pseudomonadota bacterium]
MKSFRFLVVPLLAASTLAQAQMSSDTKMPMPANASASAAGTAMIMTDGVVQDVDAGKGVVTLKHADITNMQMPAMTMSFGVADKKTLGNVKAGDKVKFHVEMVKNAPTVTRIELAK